MLLQSCPFQLPRPLLALEQAAPFLPAPTLSPGWKTFKVSLNQNISPRRGKQPHFPQKSAQGLFSQPCTNPNLPHQQWVHPQLLPGAAAALGVGEGWKTRECLSGDEGILEAAPNPSGASTGARPWVAAGVEHQPSSISSPPQTAPSFLPPFTPLSRLLGTASAC